MMGERCSAGQKTGRFLAAALGGLGQMGIFCVPCLMMNTGARQVCDIGGGGA